MLLNDGVSDSGARVRVSRVSSYIDRHTLFSFLFSSIFFFFFFLKLLDELRVGGLWTSGLPHEWIDRLMMDLLLEAYVVLMAKCWHKRFRGAQQPTKAKEDIESF